MSGKASTSLHQLDERIQRFIWAEGWESLREAQEAAVPLILKARSDVIVAAAIKRIDRKNSECRNPLGIRHGRR